MKAVQIAGLLLIGIVIGVWFFREPTWALAQKIAEQEAENQRLRLFNAREVRRFKHPGANVDWSAVSKAAHVLGTAPQVIAAVWVHENGPPDIETGVLGKTDYFAKHSPMDEWPALEAARTLNIYAWKWLTETPEGRVALKRVLKRAAKPYTGDTKADDWARNVYALQAELGAK